jgi:hypothetical protein
LEQRRSELLEDVVLVVPKVEEVQGNKLEEDEVLEEDDKLISKNL